MIIQKGITFIGMPACGKSAIGRLLADRLGYYIIDLDELIKEKEGKSHSEILEEFGEKELLRLEEMYALDLNFSRTVFSPGGSIIYSPKAMEKLRKETNIIYLELPLLEIENRLSGKIDSRGIIGLKEKGLERLFEERHYLYKKFCHHTINCRGLNQEEIIKLIYAVL